MRKIIIVLAILVLASMAFADVGTVTVKRNTASDGMEVVVFTWIANTTGVVPATSTGTTWPKDRAGCISKVVTNPGSTAPTDNYDITLTDADGVDLMGGELANRDTANSEVAVPKIDTVFGCNIVTDPFTMTITNQSVNAGNGKVIVYIILN